MKKISTCVLLLSAIFTFHVSAQKVTTIDSKAAVLTSKDSALCKQWRLISIEEFGVSNAPTDKQKKDGITFTSDGTVFFTREGKAQTGSWSLDKPRANILLNFEEPKESLRFKIMKLDDRQLKYEYQNPDLIRTIFTYEVAK